MDSGRDWIDALPPELTRQQEGLRDLLAHCQSTQAITSLSVGCSIGRLAADRLSDVDAAVGVHAARGLDGAETVRAVEQSVVDLLPQLGTLVDVLRQEIARDGFFLRSVFAQYDDRLQLDLAVVAEAEIRRGDAAPDFVALYRSEEPLDPTAHPSARHATHGQLHEWAFLGWRALLDADKYLQRGSLWEARARLDEARDDVWRLWAAGHGAEYPWHGLSQVLDHDPDLLPPGIEDTVAGLDHGDLRRAVLAAADVLDRAIGAAEAGSGTPVRPPLAAYVRRLLDQPNERSHHGVT
jgi:hypothetical protein